MRADLVDSRTQDARAMDANNAPLGPELIRDQFAALQLVRHILRMNMMTGPDLIAFIDLTNLDLAIFVDMTNQTSMIRL